MGQVVKDPDAILDYTMDWRAAASPWLADGETIASSDWSITPTGLTIESQTATDDQATVWLSGGEAGVRYLVTNTITTSAGRKDDRSFAIRCKER